MGGGRWNSGAGIPREVCDRALRMVAAGTLTKSDICRVLRIGRDSLYRMIRGEHVSQRKPKVTRCNGCGAMVDRSQPCRKCHPDL